MDPKTISNSWYPTIGDSDSYNIIVDIGIRVSAVRVLKELLSVLTSYLVSSSKIYKYNNLYHIFGDDALLL